MTDTPLISVVTVSYNQALFLDQALQSVLLQHYPKLEYIVVDGGSADDSVNIIKRYADHITWWVSEPDSGQSDALNKAISHATGEIIGWLNSDDTYSLGALNAVAAAFSDPDISIVMSETYGVIDTSGSLIATCRNNYTDYDSLVAFWKTCGMTINQPCIFFRRALLKDERYFVDQNLHFAMDYDLWLRLAQKAQITIIDGLWANYRIHVSSKSFSQVMHFCSEWKKVSRRYWGRAFSPRWFRFALSSISYKVMNKICPKKPFFSDSGYQYGPPQQLINRKPLVTVLICNYNYERFLSQAINSALLQTWRPLEIIVVDDGSTDGSRSILENYRDRDRVRVILKENGGQASAFNLGIAEARGEIICFMDSDDLWFPEKVTKVVSKYLEAPWGLVCHDLTVIDSDGRKLNGDTYAHLNNIDLVHGDLFLLLLERGLPWVFSPTSGMSLQSSIAKKLLPLPTEDWKICADNLIAYGSTCHAPTGVIKESLGSYRYHDTNGFAVPRKDLIWTRVEIIIRTVAVNDFLASHLSHINRSLPINIMDSYHFYRSVCFIAKKQPWRSLVNLLKKNIKYHFRENLSIASPFNSVRYIVLDMLLACLIVLDLPSPYRQYRKHFNERILCFTQHTKEHLMSG